MIAPKSYILSFKITRSKLNKSFNNCFIISISIAYTQLLQQCQFTRFSTLKTSHSSRNVFPKTKIELDVQESCFYFLLYKQFIYIYIYINITHMNYITYVIQFGKPIFPIGSASFIKCSLYEKGINYGVIVLPLRTVRRIFLKFCNGNCI